MSDAINMFGQRFGQLTVTSRIPREQVRALGMRGGAHWKCKCDCGMERVTFGKFLRSGQVKACAACTEVARAAIFAAKRRLDVTGGRYGMLVALRLDSAGKGQGAHWLFACDCGQQASLRLKDVRHGNTLSCGCLKHAKGYAYGAPKLMTARPWRDTPTTFAKSFEAECAGARIGGAQ